MCKNIFAEKAGEKIGVLTQNKDKLCKKLIMALVFEKKRHFFRRKLTKIAENCDHNIDPWSVLPM
jgi:alpha/beta superfamily hydrolase